jgi:hypothetical protein
MFVVLLYYFCVVRRRPPLLDVCFSRDSFLNKSTAHVGLKFSSRDLIGSCLLVSRDYSLDDLGLWAQPTVEAWNRFRVK